jgi:hypothetical protein
MEYIETQTRGGITRRCYKADSFMDAVKFVILFGGHHYAYTPDDWRVIL